METVYRKQNEPEIKSVCVQSLWKLSASYPVARLLKCAFWKPEILVCCIYCGHNLYFNTKVSNVKIYKQYESHSELNIF